jgi:hypothetical protein
MNRRYKEIPLENPYQVTENYILQSRIHELEQINNERALKKQLAEAGSWDLFMVLPC